MNQIKIDRIVSNRLSSCNTYASIKNIANYHFGFLVTPTGYNTNAMAMKLFLDTILLLYIYGFEGYSSRYKIDEMVNNLQIAVNNSDFKKHLC